MRGDFEGLFGDLVALGLGRVLESAFPEFFLFESLLRLGFLAREFAVELLTEKIEGLFLRELVAVLVSSIEVDLGSAGGRR